MDNRFWGAALLLALATHPTEAAATGVFAGVHLTITPGARIPVGLGSELSFGNRVTGGGLGYSRSGFVQLDWRSIEYFRAAFGVRIGMANETELHTVGELGAGIAVRTREGPGFHTDLGLRHGRLDGWTGVVRGEYTAPLKSTSNAPRATALLGYGGTASYFALPERATDGRPIRHDDVQRLPAVAGHAAEAARDWLQRGRTEQASVPAFLQLAAELTALGAPRALIGRALEAAADERRHAALCYAMAVRRGARFVVGPDPRWWVRGGDRRARMGRIVREAAEDGIIGEGDAAIRAARRRDSARDELVAQMENTIVVEESRHADLAKDIVMWGKSEGVAA